MHSDLLMLQGPDTYSLPNSGILPVNAHAKVNIKLNLC